MANPKTPADWRKVLARFDARGLTHKDFSQREDIGIWSFRKWRRRVGNVQKSDPGFIEIAPVVPRRPGQRATTSLVVELPGGIVLRFEGLPQ